MRPFEGVQKSQTPDPTMVIMEMDSDVRVDSDIAKGPKGPGSPSHVKEAGGDEEEASASCAVASEEGDNEEEDAEGEEKEKEGKDGEENDTASSSSYISAPITATQPSTNIASPANVATLSTHSAMWANVASLSTNSTTPPNVATPTDFIATYVSSLVCLASPQSSSVIATPHSTMTPQGFYQTHPLSSSAMAPSFELSSIPGLIYRPSLRCHPCLRYVNELEHSSQLVRLLLGCLPSDPDSTNVVCALPTPTVQFRRSSGSDGLFQRWIWCDHPSDSISDSSCIIHPSPTPTVQFRNCNSSITQHTRGSSYH